MATFPLMIWLCASFTLAFAGVPPLPDPVPVGPEINLLDEDRERERPEERLARRFEDLRSAVNEERAALIAEEILSMWRQQGGATADLLLSRGQEAETAGNLDLASRQYAWLRRLEPEFAEAWLASARVAAAQGDWPFALEAVERAIAIEPRRFDAYALLGRALEQAEAHRAALAAYEEALALYPLMPAARAGQTRLERQLSGRAL